MKNPKKTLLISGIVCLVAGILATVNIYFDIVKNFSILIVIYDALSIAISIFIGIYLITVSNFNIDRLKKQQKLFLIITFIAIFGSFLTWLVTFYSYFIYSNYIK